MLDYELAARGMLLTRPPSQATCAAIGVTMLTGQSVPSWSSIPSHILQAELHRRQETDEKPSCASANIGEYNVPIHVVALIIILVISTLGLCPSISCRTASTLTS